MSQPYKLPEKKENSPQKMSLVGRSAYLLFSGAISTLSALVSLLFIFALVSLLTSGIIPGIIIPDKIPTWGAAIILLALYLAIVLPLKSLRYSRSPHKSYSLYGSRPTQKYGDSTLWIAFFILFGWYVSQHRVELSAYLQNFPDWWRNFVDTVGPWFYR